MRRRAVGGRRGLSAGASSPTTPRRSLDLSRAHVVIATDLDGTFLGGTHEQRRRLYQLIERERDRVGLIYVTGRSLEAVAPLLGDPTIPAPDRVVADVGASIADAALRPLFELEQRVRNGWPGRERVAELYEDLLTSNDLSIQDVPQRGRLSFIVGPDPTILTTVRERAAAHGLRVIYSCDRYLDVLPGGVDKGRSLRVLLDHLGVADDRVLVCGDTLNDEALYRPGWRGVVVGGAEPALLAATLGRLGVHHAAQPGAAGIAEALTLFFGVSP